MANYLLPLITLPYLIRTLGVDFYGLIAFATATITYFVMLTDYGFNLTATKDISIHREDAKKVNEIVSMVMIIKLLLLLFSFILLNVLVFSFDRFAFHREIYFFSFGSVVGHVLFPVWFFQGMEQMKYIAYLNILVKVIFTVSIFIFIHEQGDFYLVPILTSVGFLISGLVSLFKIRTIFKVKLQAVSLKALTEYFIKSWNVFLITIFNNLYETTTTFLVGIFLNNEAIGYYAIIDKLKEALRAIFHPITQTLFPHMSSIYKHKKGIFYSRLKKALFLVFGISLGLFVMVYLGASLISYILFGKEDSLFVYLVTILIFIIPTLSVTSLLGPVVIIINRDRLLLYIMFVAGVINVATISLFAQIIGIEGVVALTVIIQYLISLGVVSIVYTHRRREINV
jgi:PST family polysaccharide transporter